MLSTFSRTHNMKYIHMTIHMDDVGEMQIQYLAKLIA